MDTATLPDNAEAVLRVAGRLAPSSLQGKLDAVERIRSSVICTERTPGTDGREKLRGVDGGRPPTTALAPKPLTSATVSVPATTPTHQHSSTEERKRFTSDGVTYRSRFGRSQIPLAGD